MKRFECYINKSSSEGDSESSQRFSTHTNDCIIMYSIRMIQSLVAIMTNVQPQLISSSAQCVYNMDKSRFCL